MANKDAPFGLRPIRTSTGGAWADSMAVPCYVDATDSNNLFIGDPVYRGGTVNSAALLGWPAGSLFEVIRATAAGGNYFSGVIVGFLADQDDLTKHYRVASTERIVLVCDDPDVIFECQEDSDGGALTAADAGLNADIVIGTGSTTTGLSAVEIDSSTVATTNTLQLRLLRLKPVEDNEIGSNAVWEVKINLHTARYTTGA